jgi:glycosyltransferase involved in cell wall biosynthesis
LRIAHITSQFPPLWGGVGNSVHGQVEELAARGHEVHVITRRIPPDAKVPPMDGNITVHHVPMLRLPMAFTTSFAKHAVKKLLELGNDFDLVHHHSNMALLQKRHYDRIRRPIVSTAHGTWRGERSMIRWKDVTASVESLNDLAVLYLSRVFDRYEDYAFQCSDAIIIECENEMRAWKDRGVRNIHGEDRVVQLAAGINSRRYRPENADPGVTERHGGDPGRPLVLFVGRLAARKGALDALETFRRAHRVSGSSQLMVLGSGPQERALRKRIGTLGLKGSVHLLGSVPFPELQAMYANADVLLFPSYWEGQGLVPGEAMASGTPVVASRVGWVPQLVRPGENGFHHDARDVEEAAMHLVTLLSDEGLRKRLGQQARRDIEDRWDWRHHVDRLERLYEEVSVDR